MGSQPFIIRRITGKAAAQLIIDSAADHLVQAQTGLIQRRLVLCEVVIVKQKTDRKGLGKFRRTPKTTILRIGRSQQLVTYLPQRFRRKRAFIIGIYGTAADTKRAGS